MQMVSAYNYLLVGLWVCFWILMIFMMSLVIKKRQKRFRKDGLVPLTQSPPHKTALSHHRGHDWPSKIPWT